MQHFGLLRDVQYFMLYLYKSVFDTFVKEAKQSEVICLYEGCTILRNKIIYTIYSMSNIYTVYMDSILYTIYIYNI